MEKIKIIYGLFVLILLIGCSTNGMEDYELNIKQCHKFYEIDCNEDNETVWVIDTNAVEENWFCDREQTTHEYGYYFKYVTIYDN